MRLRHGEGAIHVLGAAPLNDAAVAGGLHHRRIAPIVDHAALTDGGVEPAAGAGEDDFPCETAAVT